MFGGELAQLMEACREDFFVFILERQFAHRIERHDDAGRVAAYAVVEVVVRLLQAEVFAVGREVAPAVAQVVERPIAATVSVAKRAEPVVEVVFDLEHAWPEMPRQESEAACFRYPCCGHGMFDVVNADVSHDEILIKLL